MDFHSLLEKAHNQATAAMEDFLAGYRGVCKDQSAETLAKQLKNCGVTSVDQLEPLYCGRAWISIKGTTPLAKFCNKMEAEQGRGAPHGFYGMKGYPKGWEFYCPGTYRGQSMDVFEAGAKAFAEVLRENNIECVFHSRAD